MVVLVSTYDLGRQPFGVASPAAWLRRAGLATQAIDVSRERLSVDAVSAARVVAFYLPMHTATRLALPVIDRVRSINPDAVLCAYGLYAQLNEALLREHGVTIILGPEAEEALVDLAVRSGGALDAPRMGGTEVPPLRTAGGTDVPPPRTAGGTDVPPPRTAGGTDVPPPRTAGGTDVPPLRTLPRLQFIQPDRAGLPPLEKYAALVMPDGSRRLVGSTDATRGCKHRCRHCPIVPVYNGQFRVVPVDVVIADVRAQIERGASHITFNDPDFFNGPGHARKIVEALHHEFPSVTYDATIKIEHLLQHRELLRLLAATGCEFVTSAVESVDDAVLEKLEKGHTRAGFIEAAGLCRQAQLTLVPTFVAFTPWTTLASYHDLVNVVDDLGLTGHVAPVQWSIRLLVTFNSRLLELTDIQRVIGPFDPKTLTFPWRHPDPRVDELQQQMMALARQPRPSRTTVPYLDEPWYC